MRNPAASLPRVHGSKQAGEAVRTLFDSAVDQWPDLLSPARAILQGEEPQEYPAKLVQTIRDSVLTLLGATSVQRTRERTAKACTPLSAAVIQAWGNVARDPDSDILAQWLDHGAPLGITEQIPTSGVFPPSPGVDKVEADHIQARSLEGWCNYSSAVEEAKDLQELLHDYVERGFCRLLGESRAWPRLRPQ